MVNLTVEEQLEAPIEDILGRWPDVSQVFIANRMSCIGCPIAKFHTLKEACQIYLLNFEEVVGQVTPYLEAGE